jgi:hypothetical protein
MMHRGRRQASWAIRSWWALAAALAIALGASASPGQAKAGEFTIDACQADAGNFASGAFEDFATRGMRWRRACNPLGPGLRGLVTANVTGRGRVAHGAQSAFVLDAPPGTAFSSLRWSGHAHRRDCRYALQLYARRPDGSSVAIKNVRANHHCPHRGHAQASGWPRPRAYGLGGATRIVQRVVCVGTSSHQSCSARGLNYLQTFTAEATVSDSLGPAVSILSDGPLARGEWVSGMQSVGYETSDNVGVKSAQGWIGGLVRKAGPRPCDYSQRVPCPNGPGQIEVDTRQLPEGSQEMHVTAEDAAGNTADSPSATVRIDNTPPGAVPVGVGGGEAWRNRNDFDLAWEDPPEPDRAPIVAAHYRLCLAEGGECVTGTRSEPQVAAIESLAVPAPGEWELSLWREDAAGNQQPANASVPVKLRFDPEPPMLGFEGARADDPTRVSVLVTDPLSGLGGGEIEISQVGSGVWQELPTAQEGSHLVTRIDDAALPPGEYELHATAHDVAGNEASTNQRLDGQPMRVTLPLRVTTSIKAGVVGKRRVRRTVHRHGKSHKVSQTVRVLEPSARVEFGRQMRFAGRVLDREGKPIAAAPVRVFSRSPAGSEALAASLSTDPEGRFSLALRARASSRLRFVYAGTATTLPVEDAVTLLVRARSSFTVSPKHVLNGQSVTFSGQVWGRPLPARGKLVELQVLLSGEWQTFRTTRTDAKGRWRIRYPFQRTCGGQRFRFRAHLPEEAGYPLQPGGSGPLSVRVRGRPCSTG